MKPIKDTIAFVVWNEDREKILAVQRPQDDEDLPNVWGLPAGSLRPGEIFEDCVFRAGTEKLNVKLKIVGLVAEGEIERERYTLYMKEFEAVIVEGTPSISRDVKNITIYQDWKWAEPGILIDAAQKGSLCSRLFLNSLGMAYQIVSL